ncbi:endonuclease NucS domain-containing protein [Methylophilus sp.]|uniref:endonuclease NucS domain-containing protein n=1 Tax=Methylophilus sp. TaxID=29541 RepID=UPI004037025B
MKNYYRLMLGKKSIYAAECFAGGFVGTYFGLDEDFTGKLPEKWRDFNKTYIPYFLEANPGKSKIAAGLACGMVWTVSKGIKKGDIVLCPDGNGLYHLGEIDSDYYYVAGENLPHRRKVNWLNISIARSAMSEALRNSTGSIGTVSYVSDYASEIETFIVNTHIPVIIASDSVIEDPVAFAMEKHLEAFLVANWNQTELAKNYTIYQEDGEIVGQQYSTDAGQIDILAVSKDNKKLLVVELKRGRASDVVVGQILRYMGYIKEQIAEKDQKVEGVIIALEDDQKLKWALAAVDNISFYRYEVNFKLIKA